MSVDWQTEELQLHTAASRGGAAGRRCWWGSVSKAAGRISLTVPLRDGGRLRTWTASSRFPGSASLLEQATSPWTDRTDRTGCVQAVFRLHHLPAVTPPSHL